MYVDLTVVASLTKIHILPGGFLDHATQRHFGLDRKALLDQR